MWITEKNPKIPFGFLEDFSVLHLIYMCEGFKLYPKYSFFRYTNFFNLGVHLVPDFHMTINIMEVQFTKNRIRQKTKVKILKFTREREREWWEREREHSHFLCSRQNLYSYPECFALLCCGVGHRYLLE